MSRLNTFYIITTLKEQISCSKIDIYPNACILQEDSKDLEIGQVNFTFLD